MQLLLSFQEKKNEECKTLAVTEKNETVTSAFAEMGCENYSEESEEKIEVFVYLMTSMVLTTQTPVENIKGRGATSL